MIKEQEEQLRQFDRTSKDDVGREKEVFHFSDKHPLAGLEIFDAEETYEACNL
jgi:hypothetical protein